MLSRLNLEPAKSYLVSQFIDTYQKLNKYQEREYQSGLQAMPEKEEVMEMITSWKREGIEEGLQQGRQLALRFIKGYLHSRYGRSADRLESKIECCPTEQLDAFGSKALESQSIEELEDWLDSNVLRGTP